MKSKSIYSKIHYGRCAAFCVALLSLSMLSGCGSSDMDALVEPRDVSYTAVEHETVEVQKGDLSPVFEKVIELVGYEEQDYRVEKYKAEDMEAVYKAEFDKLHVSVGDRVKAGDTLISFKSESLEKELKENEETKTEAATQKEHYEKLMQIDSSLDYRDEIASLEDDIELAEMHIQDINDTYASMNIICEKDGVVSYIDTSLQDGFLPVGAPVIKVSDDLGYYEMDLTDDSADASAGDAALITTDFEFNVGEVYKAKTYLSEFDVEVISDPSTASDTDAVSTGTDAISNGKVYFKLLGDNTIKESVLMLSAEMPEIKNALYVDRKAIIDNDDGHFYVYKQVDGELIVHEVKIGDSVGQYVIIKEGLEEGDVVSLSE